MRCKHFEAFEFQSAQQGQMKARKYASMQVLALGPGKMRMYYHSFSPKKQKWVIGYATSHDGFNWKKEGPIFEGGEDSDFDAKGAASHCVVQDVDSGRQGLQIPSTHLSIQDTSCAKEPCDYGSILSCIMLSRQAALYILYSRDSLSILTIAYQYSQAIPGKKMPQSMYQSRPENGRGTQFVACIGYSFLGFGA